MELTEALVRKFAQTALGHVAREYPNKLDHVMGGDADAATPRELHPSFFGSYDWHSCVHGWWMLLTLQRLYPGMPEAAQIDALAQKTFTERKLAAELAYIERPDARGFERPYGWAWLLYLHNEADQHEDREWAQRLKPLASAFASRFKTYLPILTYPITVGTHYNTAFALALTREWAEERDPDLLRMIDKWSHQAFDKKSHYSGWEPGGDEFLSPVLTAALLMSKVMLRDQFEPWFDRLIVTNGWLERECHPVTVSDRSDGKIAHLDGLNLSRTWCLRGIAAALGQSELSTLIDARAKAHFDAALPHVAGDYMGEHWLASFALLAMLAEEQTPLR